MEAAAAAATNVCHLLQVLNPEDLAQVVEGFFWMMLAVLVLSLASLSVAVLELVFTTVATLRMLVLCVQVHVQSANGLEINYSCTTQPHCLPSILFFSFLGLAIVGFTRQSYIVSEGDQLHICVEVIEGELVQESIFILRPSINGNTTSE